jgi:peptide-methionine (S)-S-oxide reductase
MIRKALLAGGCFWCTEAICKRVRGVVSVTPGYAGGHVENPSYEQVSTGATGHTEAVEVAYDPSIIPYTKLLEIFWHTHDPTTVNRQGNDVGPQYRSVVFFRNEEERLIAEALKQKLNASGEFAAPIVTDILPFTNFFPAENHHRDYYDRYPSQGYCSFIITPKIANLLETYQDEVKAEYKNAAS